MDIILEHLQGKSAYNDRGEELPDPRPKELKIDLEAELPLEVKVMRAIQSREWNEHMEKQGMETFDEANDFDVPEEESEFKTIHEDESGDVMAFEEGVRRGFIEEIPEAKRKEIEKTVRVADELRNRTRENRAPGGAESGLQTKGDLK